MSSEHTPIPWRFKEVEASFQIWGEGEIRVAATSWHGSLRQPFPLKDEARANVSLIVRAVNSYHANLSEIAGLRELVRECVKQLDMIIERGEPTDFIQWRAELADALAFLPLNAEGGDK